MTERWEALQSSCEAAVETTTASVEVIGLSQVRGRGGLVGLVIVELLLDDVPVVLQGVRIVRRSGGLAVVEMPCYRAEGGEMIPAVALPDELEEAIARQVLSRFAPGGAVMTLPSLAESATAAQSPQPGYLGSLSEHGYPRSRTLPLEGLFEAEIPAQAWAS